MFYLQIQVNIMYITFSNKLFATFGYILQGFAKSILFRSLFVFHCKADYELWFMEKIYDLWFMLQQ